MKKAVPAGLVLIFTIALLSHALPVIGGTKSSSKPPSGGVPAPPPPGKIAPPTQKTITPAASISSASPKKLTLLPGGGGKTATVSGKNLDIPGAKVEVLRNGVPVTAVSASPAAPSGGRSRKITFKAAKGALPGSGYSAKFKTGSQVLAIPLTLEVSSPPKAPAGLAGKKSAPKPGLPAAQLPSKKKRISSLSGPPPPSPGSETGTPPPPGIGGRVPQPGEPSPRTGLLVRTPGKIAPRARVFPAKPPSADTPPPPPSSPAVLFPPGSASKAAAGRGASGDMDKAENPGKPPRFGSRTIALRKPPAAATAEGTPSSPKKGKAAPLPAGFPPPGGGGPAEPAVVSLSDPLEEAQIDPCGDNPPQYCFGAVGSQCGWGHSGAQNMSTCNPATSTCEINGGSIAHDECCFRDPDGHMCENNLTNACKDDWDRAVSRTALGLSWSRRVDFDRPNCTGFVVLRDYCAPDGSLIHENDKQYCCTGPGRELICSVDTIMTDISLALDLGQTPDFCENLWLCGPADVAYRAKTAPEMLRLLMRLGENIGNELDAFLRLEALGYVAEDIAAALIEVFGSTAAEITEVFREAGKTAIETAGVLKALFGKTAEEAAELMKDKRFDVDGIAQAMKAVFSKTGEATAKILKKLGYRAKTVARVLRDHFSGTAAQVSQWLQKAGYKADAVAEALKEVFSRTAGQAAQLLKDAGFDYEAVLAAIIDVFSMAVSQAISLLAAIFGP